jgi:hypothetical protein
MAGEPAGQRQPSGRELGDARREWEQRYRDRPETTAEREAVTLLSTRRVRPDDHARARGMDGAWYAASAFRLYSSTFDDPAVTVITRAQAVEIVTGFASPAARDEWLADRMPGRAGPLASALDGPPSRAAREELVLAWLLRAAAPAAPLPDWLPSRTFTTYSRSEILLALRETGLGAPPAEFAAALDRRLRLAPDWAAADIGPRGARTVPAYLHRIAATPVSEERSADALRQLAIEDATLAPPARPRTVITGLRPAPGRAQSPQPPRLPGPDGPYPGPVPHL